MEQIESRGHARASQSAPQETPALEVEDLSYGYTARDLVFDSVDFELYAGEVAFLTGPNGAGNPPSFDASRAGCPQDAARSAFLDKKRQRADERIATAGPTSYLSTTCPPFMMT